MATYVYENKDGLRIEREFPMAGKIPRQVKHEGKSYSRVITPPHLATVRGNGRRGNDGYFVGRSLPLDPGNSQGIYDRVDSQGRPLFASQSEVDRAELKLNRLGLDVHYEKKPEVRVDKGSTDEPPSYAGVRTKMANLEAAGKFDNLDSPGSFKA